LAQIYLYSKIAVEFNSSNVICLFHKGIEIDRFKNCSCSDAAPRFTKNRTLWNLLQKLRERRRSIC
jgi:hypothetical protein